MRASTMGGFRPPPLTPTSRLLLWLVGGVFLAQLLMRIVLGFDAHRYATLVERPLGLSGSGFWSDFFLWQPLTYFWLSPMHSVGPIFFSLLAIYLIVPAVERQLGRTRTLIAFASCGIAGGLVTALVAVLFMRNHALYSHAFLGTQAATLGLLSTLCWWWRDQPLNLVIVRPLGWQVLAGLVALTVIQGLLSPSPFLVSPDLGGVLMGMGVAAGYDPYGLFQRWRLWRLRKRVRVIRGGKDDRDWMN